MKELNENLTFKEKFLQGMRKRMPSFLEQERGSIVLRNSWNMFLTKEFIEKHSLDTIRTE
jgi:hypothetical protein